MSSGTIKFFNESKGFGFVVEDGTNQEYFVHASGLVDKVDKNDKVSFSVVEGQKGKNAVDVKKIS
jgi:CspA family cold shock protein